jgi:hypothetical protein
VQVHGVGGRGSHFVTRWGDMDQILSRREQKDENQGP